MARYSKSLVSTIFFMMFCTAMYAQVDTGVKIHGKLLNNSSFKEIYLDLFQNQSQKTDTGSIDKEGGFRFAIAAPETNLCKLRLSDDNYLMLVVFPGEDIDIQANAEVLGNNPAIKGSPSTQQIYDFGRSLLVFDQKTDSLNKVGKTYENSPERDSIMPVLQKFYQDNEAARIRLTRDFIEKNTGSLVSLFFIEKLDMDEQFDTYRKLAQGLKSKYPKNAFVLNFVSKVADNEKIAIGSPAPDIALPDTSGKIVSLSSLKGKVVVIDFWASWCGPCRKENPNMVRLYKKYHDNGFEIFGVSLDKSRESWLKGIRDDKLTWYEVSDLKYWKSEAAQLYKVGAIPYTVLLDKEGRIIAKKLRGPELEAKLTQMFGF